MTGTMVNLDAVVRDYEALLLGLDTAVYQDKVTLALRPFYTALGWIGETGEAAEKIKKVLRDNGGVVTEEARKLFLLELSDLCWYTIYMLTEKDRSISDMELGLFYSAEGDVNDLPEHMVNLAIDGAKILERILDNRAEAPDLRNLFVNIILCAEDVGSDLQTVLQMNIAKLSDRKERSVIQGSGDER